MLLSRDFVAHISAEVVKRLVESEMIEIKETKAADAVALQVRHTMQEELAVEDRLNEEVREILMQHQEEMRRSGVSFQDMFKKAKQQLARERKLILR